MVQNESKTAYALLNISSQHTNFNFSTPECPPPRCQAIHQIPSKQMPREGVPCELREQLRICMTNVNKFSIECLYNVNIS